MGHRFDPLAENPGKVVVDDIAHALSNLCRYTGHCSKFYSVAQHSVLVAKILREKGYHPAVQLQGLLHDATEAYMNDIARPIKHTPEMAGYRAVEDRLEKFIAKEWGFETLTPPPVKWADMVCLATETRDLMGDPKDWDLPHGPAEWIIVPQVPEAAKQEFFRTYLNLMKETGRV